MNKSNIRQYRSILIAVIVLGLVLRIIIILWIPTVPTEDFWSYFQRALHITDYGTYDAILGRHDASYPPGYSLLLSLFFRLPFDRLLIAKFVNVFLSLSMMILISGISGALFNQEVALVAAAIAALSPRLILQNTLIASENLFIPLLLLWIFINIYSIENLRLMKTFFTGCLLGVISLTRSVSWLLWIPWLLSLLPRKIKSGKLTGLIIILLLGQMLIMLPWAIRNCIVLGKGTFFTTTGGIDLFIGNNANASGEWYYWPPDMINKYPDFSNQSVVMQDQLAQQEAINWIKANPMAALKLYFKKWKTIFRDEKYTLDMAIFSKQLSPPWPASDVLIGSHSLKNYREILVDLFNAHYWLLLFSGSLGIIVSLIKFLKVKDTTFFSRWLLMALSALYFPAVTSVFLADTRFHWPTTDLLIPFSAYTVVLMYTRILLISKKKSPDNLSEE